MWQDSEKAPVDEARKAAREQISEIVESLCDGKSAHDRKAIADELENVVRSAARSDRLPDTQQRSDWSVRLLAFLTLVILALAAVWGVPMLLNFIQY
jgi:hypothetical protein